MPLHMSEAAKWQLLIDSVVAKSSIRVISVDHDGVHVVGASESIEDLQGVLCHQDTLKSKVLHAVRMQDQDSALIAAADEQAISGVHLSDTKSKDIIIELLSNVVYGKN